jgi:hypothetical protein
MYLRSGWCIGGCQNVVHQPVSRTIRREYSAVLLTIEGRRPSIGICTYARASDIFLSYRASLTSRGEPHTIRIGAIE